MTGPDGADEAGETAREPASAPSEPASPFPRIDGYQVVGVLGRGATGVVYSAVQRAVDRPVALKVLHRELLGSKNAIRRLQREARTAARLAHPSIITAIDMGEQDGQWWYAMELVEGISLAERVEERGPMSEREALRFFIPLCDGLQHSVEQGVVHRDIKPANILVDAQARARLADLGLAFAEDDPTLTRPGGTLGTPHYISPEQARDPTAADARSDIWSLGATMFHAVCGRPPFEGDSVAEILSGVLHGRITDPRHLAPHLSRGFALVLRKCLSRAPDRRYQEPAELMHDLEAIRERRTPEVRAAQLDPVAGEGRGRKAAVAGVSAVVLAAAGWWTWARLQPPEPERSAPAAPAPWPALVELERASQSGSVSLADGFTRLAQLGRAPEGWGLRRQELETALGRRLDEALEGVRGAVEARLRQHLLDHDYGAARAVLDEPLDRELRERTGFLATTLPGPRVEELAAWRRTHLEQVGQAERDSVAVATDLLKRHFKSVVEPRAQALAAEQRWRSALEVLEDAARWWEAPELAELPLSEEQRRQAESELVSSVRALRTSWTADFYALDRTLESFVEQEGRRLAQALAASKVSDAARRLREAYAAERLHLGIDADELPRAWSQGDLQRATGSARRLEEVAAELEQREREVLVLEAENLFQLDAEEADRLCADRRYALAVALWEDRQAEEWRASVRAAMQQRAAEAALGAEVLDRAWAGILARRDDGRTIQPTFDTISYPGARIVAVGRAVEEGFRIEPKRVPEMTVQLVRPAAEGEKVLRARDVLELADLSRLDLAPRERFLRAVFLQYEGQYSEALQSLPAPGEQFPERDLLPDLERRIQAAIDKSEARRSTRRADLQHLLTALERSADQGGTPQRRLLDIERILADYPDLLEGPQRRELEARVERLRNPGEIEPVEAAYGPDVELEPLGQDRVAMRWDFTSGTRGAWSLGDQWSSQAGQGLTLLIDTVRGEDLFAPARQLALPLRAPVQLARDLALTLELEVDADRKVRTDLALEVAGLGVVLVFDPQRPRMVTGELGPGGAAALLARADRSEDKAVVPVRNLPVGRPFVLSVRHNPRLGGKLEVLVDGLEVDGVEDAARRTPPEDTRIVLCSQRRTRVLRAALEVSVTRQ